MDSDDLLELLRHAPALKMLLLHECALSGTLFDALRYRDNNLAPLVPGLAEVSMDLRYNTIMKKNKPWCILSR